MNKVTITNGIYMGKVINGTYEMVSRWYPEGDISRDPKHGKVKVIINGNQRGVWVNEEDISYSEGPAPEVKEITNEEILERIKKRFDVMNKMSNGVIAGVVRSLIISGAPGVGKTYSLEKKLVAAEESGRINYEMVKGKISPIGLYIKLYESRDAGSVVVLDDIDVFSNEDTLNILKAALDSGDRRIISWGTASTYLDEKDIPNSFEFEGSIIFITNTDIDAELQRGSKNAPHLDALVSRSVYLDLAVHTNRDIMVWVENVITTTDMLEKKGLSQFQIVQVVEWMKDHVDNLRNVSLRTAMYIADFILTEPNGWQDIAEVTMLRPR